MTGLTVKSRRILSLFLAMTVAIPVVPAMTVSGKAQTMTLQDFLFGRNRRSLRERQVQEVPQAPPQVRRVSSPRYYTYKPAALTTVTVASLLPAPSADGTLQPSLDFEASRFAEALRLAPDTAIAMEKDIADALKAHYAKHPAFLWSRGNSVTDQAKSLVALMQAADEHGLSTTEYTVTVPSDGWSMDNPAARTANLLAFDIALSARAIRYAMDMKDGEINPNKLSGYHDFPLPRMTAAKAIEGLAEAGDPVQWMKTLEPHQPEYAALKKELAALEAMDVEDIVLPDKILLKPGGSDEALPQIMKALRKHVTEETRDKHAATFAEYFGTPEYTDAIAALVKDFQRDNGLSADGIIGRNTLGHLANDTHSSKVERVKLAMERLRWHPEEFGTRHVVINQPAFRASYYENDHVKLSTRAIIGKRTNQTSFFFDKIETVVYNPYWGVPQSIIVNEMLPKLYQDPSYLDRAGYEVTTASGQRVSSSSVDWWQYGGKVPFNVRQLPGPSNALGDIKILFPNKHDIYMHDTPSRNLFSRNVRALSHGCVRLQKPREMAAAVLGTDVDYISSRIGGGRETSEDLPQQVPVFVAYFTAWPTDTGEVEYFADIYGRDSHLEKALEALHKVRESADS